MKILVLADQRSKALYDYYEPQKLEGIDLILSCGDLEPHYLSFFATLCHAPVLYVRGNHDEIYETMPPEVCICIEDDIYVHNGVRIMGLGGSMEYYGGKHQYTESQMRLRVGRLWFQIMRRGGFDILVTHAPAFELNDGKDLPHRGFQTFLTLMERYRPKYFLHGHVHRNYSRDFKRYDKYLDTKVINAYERCVFEYEDESAE